MMVNYSLPLIFRVMLVFSLSMSMSECKPVQVLSGGSISDGLDLSDIRVGEHSGYIRIVFDVKYWKGYGAPKAGTSSDNVGHYKFTLNEDHTIEAEFSGFRSANAKDITAQGIVHTVKRLRGEEYGDDSSVFYQIILRHPAKLKVFHLYDPARIILDISKL